MDADYTDVPLIARVDHDLTKLNIYAVIHGVEVLLASHKSGHFVPNIEANKSASEAAASAPQEQ